MDEPDTKTFTAFSSPIPNIVIEQSQSPSPTSSVREVGTSIANLEQQVTSQEEETINNYFPMLLFAVGGVIWGALMSNKGMLNRSITP